MSVAQAIRSMTSLPAEIMGFKKRGLVREGYWADLAVLDIAKVRDTATFFDPFQYPEGIDYVTIKGKFVVEYNQPTFALVGEVLMREIEHETNHT